MKLLPMPEAPFLWTPPYLILDEVFSFCKKSYLSLYKEKEAHSDESIALLNVVKMG